MKKIFLSVVSVLLVSFVAAQNFPSTKVELLQDKVVKPKQYDDSYKKFHYKNFYSTFDSEKGEIKDLDDLRLFATSKYSFISDYEKLVGKEFKVVKIYPPKNSKKYVLELKNEDFGTVYYNYSPEYEFDFELEVVGGIDLPEGFYCDKVSTENDKFTGETTYTTDFEDGISFVKIVKNKIPNFYMQINTTGSTLNVGKKGLIVLLDNGTKIQKPNAKIDVSTTSSGGGYVYSAFVSLTKNDISLLKQHNITAARLYIYDSNIEGGFKLKDMLKCITK
nr:MAG TPA: hypothetical protein [Caudoviricetes sp.]